MHAVQKATVAASCLVRTVRGSAPRRCEMSRAPSHDRTDASSKRSTTVVARALHGIGSVQRIQEQASLDSPAASPFDALGRVVEAGYDLVIDRIEFARKSLEQKIAAGVGVIVLVIAAAPPMLVFWGLLVAAIVVWLEPLVGLAGALASAAGLNLLLGGAALVGAWSWGKKRGETPGLYPGRASIPPAYRGADVALAEAGADLRHNTGLS